MKNSPIIVAALIAAFFSGCSGSDPVVAEVNESAIRASDLEQAITQEKKKYDDVLITSPSSMQQLKKQTLELKVQEEILLHEARRLSISVTDEELDEQLGSHFGTLGRSKIEDLLEKHGLDADRWFKGQRDKLIISKLVRREVIDGIPVTQKEIEASYRTNIDDYRQPVQYRALQILVDSRELADEIAKRLAEGEDFAELARTHSISPDAERGGDIGFFSTKGFPPAFSEICASLSKGKISEVKKTDYGYQIFKLLDRRPPRTQPLTEVRDEIAEFIRRAHGKEAFAAWFEKLRSQATITIAQDKQQEGTPHE